MHIHSRRRLATSVSRIAVVAAAISLGGCGGFLTGSDEPAVPQLVRPNPQDAASSAAYWGTLYEADRNNTEAALQFARNLRQMGGAKQAVALLKEVVMRAPDNTQILSEYGKALTEAGRPADALPFFSRALQAEKRDWTLLSAYAVALDQTGNHAQAQSNYEAALAISPQNPIVQGNLAMSFVLAGDLSRGEEILRELVSRPDATPQMRQNLAMVASLRGNRHEAENLSRQDLSPTDTQHNLALLQQLGVADKPTIEKTPLVAPTVQERPAAEVTTAPQPTKTAERTSEVAAPVTTAALDNPAAGPDDTILPLTKPKDMSALPLPARIVAELPRPDQASAQQIEATTQAPTTPAPATRRPILTMQPIADEAETGTTRSAAPRAEAQPQAPAASIVGPSPLRRSLAAESLNTTGNLSVASSDF